MLGRRSRAAVIEKEVADAGSKAAETVSELAERAVSAARDAQRVATPVLRSAAHTSADALTYAAEKAAGVFAETAEKLASTEAGLAARSKLADASEALAGAVRPKVKRHRVRRLFVVSAILGAVYAVLKYTPLKSKIAALAFGPPIEDDEPEPITLPASSPATASHNQASTSPESAKPDSQDGGSTGSESPSAAAAEGDGVVSSSAGKSDGTAT